MAEDSRPRRFCSKCGTPRDDDGRFCANCGAPLPPIGGAVADIPAVAVAAQPLASTMPMVEVRNYPSTASFQIDAIAMSGAGWFVQSQSSSKASNAGRIIGFGLLGLVLGFLVLGYIGAIVFGVLGGAIGAAGSEQVLTVTYRFHGVPAPLGS